MQQLQGAFLHDCHVEQSVLQLLQPPTEVAAGAAEAHSLLTHLFLGSGILEDVEEWPLWMGALRRSPLLWALDIW